MTCVIISVICKKKSANPEFNRNSTFLIKNDNDNGCDSSIYFNKFNTCSTFSVLFIT